MQSNKIQFQSSDLDNLDLELYTSPMQVDLSLFVFDPETDQYAYRKIKVRSKSNSGNGIKADIISLNIGNLVNERFPEEDLVKVSRHMSTYQGESGNSYDETIQQSAAAVGVAKYLGDKEFTLDQIVALAGIKYHKEKLAFYRSAYYREFLSPNN